MPSKPARIGWRWSGQDSSYPFGECPVSGVHGSAFQYALRKSRKAMKKYRKDTEQVSTPPGDRRLRKAGVGDEPAVKPQLGHCFAQAVTRRMNLYVQYGSHSYLYKKKGLSPDNPLFGAINLNI
jgi:hypothetical protein